MSLGFDIPPQEDRYEVTSISGYTIAPDCHTLDTNGKWRTLWYIVDRFDAYRIVRERNGRNAESLARRECHIRNRRERRWEVTGED